MVQAPSAASPSSMLDRVAHYHADFAQRMKTSSPEEISSTENLLLSVFNFFASRERPLSDTQSHTHLNYGGIARSWYSTLTGRFRIENQALPELYLYMVKLWRLGIPLQLVEAVEGLTVIPFVMDLDVKDCGIDPKKFEDQLIDEPSSSSAARSFRFLKFIARILHTIYSVESGVTSEELLKMEVFSATGLVGKESGKVSIRVIFPNLIVNRERAQKLRDSVVEKLNHYAATAATAASGSSPVSATAMYLLELKKLMLGFNPSNHYRNVVDESIVRCRHGMRMVFNEKLVHAQPSGRVFVPLFELLPVYATAEGKTKVDGVSVASLRVGKKFSQDLSPAAVSDCIEWLRLSSIRTPTVNHNIQLSEWREEPMVKPTKLTRTGPGGSSLALTSFNTNDAIRAANRIRNTAKETKPQTNCKSSYLWESGSVELFQRRIPPGIEGDVIVNDQTVEWTLTKRRNNKINFNESTHIVEITADSAEALKLLAKIVERFPGAIVTTQNAIRQQPARKAPEIKTAAVTTPNLYVVLKSFPTEEETELDVSQGDVVTLVDPSDSLTSGNDWILVERQSDKKRGYVPATFIKLM